MSSHLPIEHATFDAKVEVLSLVISWVRQRVSKLGFSQEEIRNIESALEETILGIIQHAYKDQSGVVELIYRYYPEQKLELTLIDKGHYFNPLQVDRVQTRALQDEGREIHSRISLTRSLMDHVHYERRHPYNVLTLVKSNPKIQK